jgi:DNA-binding CsgD family transcriptional regulator
VPVLRPSHEVVGRTSELEMLPRFLDAITESPAALVLEGEAGIGKTTLWLSGVRLARERGCGVLACRTTQAEGQLPFVALGDLFERVSEPALATLPEPQRRAFEVAMLKSEWYGPAIERRAVAMGVLGVLRVLAEAAPVVVAVDDLQWLDLDSAAALQFALRRLHGEQVGVLATRRSSEPAGAVAGAFPDDRVRLVRVTALKPNELGRLLLERLELPLARPALLQLYRLSAGNPFLALEIARALQRREVPLEPGEPFPVPLNLRELVRDRLDRLSPAGREAGLVTAALAQATVERVLQATVAAGADPEGLHEAEVAGIVEIEADRVRFTHPLLGSIIYSEASTAQRRALHARLATVADDVEERVTHLALAATGPDPRVAAALDAAAGNALRRGAPEAAADLYERAVRLTPPPDHRLRHRRMIDAGKAHARAGDVPSARRAFDAAVQAAPDRSARARALRHLGSMLLLDWRPEPSGSTGIPAALAAYERARREDESPMLLAETELDLAWLYYFRGERIASCAHARRAIELAERVKDEELVTRALVAAALMEGRWRRGNGAARRFLRQSFQLKERVAQRQFSDRPEFVHTLFLAADGRLDEARAIVLAEYDRALEQGDEGSLPTLLEHLTIFERRAGNWDGAESYAREMHEAAERSRILPAYLSAPYAWILALRGEVEKARATAETGRALADAGGIGPTFGGHRAVLGFIALSAGDVRGCTEILEPLSRLLTPEIPETGWFRFLADEIEASVELGELERAKALVARLSERRGVLLDRAWAHAATHRCQGLVLAARGDRNGSDDAFARAVKAHARLREPFELARTLLARGRVERRFKRRRASRESLEAAHSLFSKLGSPLWASRTEEELGRIGGRQPRPPGLTPTERRVAELAAEGLTNREIASALFLSPNTVQAYLKRIYRELGVRSRTELARKLLPQERSKSTDSGVSAAAGPT